MTISKPLFVYLQRPDTGEWVTVGRYARQRDDEPGIFMYAPSYIDARLPWSVDPVNLPLIGGIEHLAQRYRGLHDVLRDTCPDAWGRQLLQREYQLPDNAHDSDYLRLARNGDRWGALATGAARKPSIDAIRSPKLQQLDGLVEELQAMSERRPPVDARLRKVLMSTPSMGGARPKGTLRDGEDYWLVKPIMQSDVADIPRLEHFTLKWGTASGLNFAQSVHHQVGGAPSVVRVLRFDRKADRRKMAISAASLLSAEYPGGLRAGWSYPLLAQLLQRIGAPQRDQIELFDRMVFNAMVGNDDDHPRNHAAIYDIQEKRWRLSPAFDVVPNPEMEPKALAMQVSAGRFDITREAVLADVELFGFKDQNEAELHLDALLDTIASAFPTVQAELPAELSTLLRDRLANGMRQLAARTTKYP
jgi:serine/threonine-protein kinase HipA